MVGGFVALPLLTCVVGALLFVPYNLFAYSGLLKLAAALHAIAFALAGGVLLFHYRKPSASRDGLLMVFPLIYLVGHLYIYVAKFRLFFEVGPDGLSQEGLAAGNLLAVVVAMIGSAAILLATHPSEPR